MKKRVSIILLVMVLILSNTMSVMAASATETAAKKAYNKYISKKDVYQTTKIVDVDKNGVPELLMMCKYSGTWYYTLCTYNKKTKKVVVLKKVVVGKEYPACLQYNVSKKQVHFTQASTGGAKDTIVQVKGTKISTVSTYESKRMYPSFEYTYKVNGKKASYNTWEKKRTAALKGFKDYR